MYPYFLWKHSDIEASELMDIARFLDSWFITDYAGNLPIMKGRLMTKGSKYCKETIENAESTLSIEIMKVIMMMWLNFPTNEESCHLAEI